VRNLVIVVSLLLLAWISPARAGKVHLEYHVSWVGIPAGKIKMTIQEEPTGIYLLAKSKTVGVVKVFFPFKSRWETWCRPDGYPVKSRIWRKKRRKEVTKIFVFDQEKGIVRRFKKGQTKEYRLEHYPVYDELSAFYATMKADWSKVGEEKVFWIYAHKKANRAVVKYEKDEEVKDHEGRKVQAKKLLVQFGFESELVKRAKKAYLWLHDGLVIKSEGDLAIGHLTGTLVKVEKEE